MELKTKKLITYIILAIMFIPTAYYTYGFFAVVSHDEYLEDVTELREKYNIGNWFNIFYIITALTPMLIMFLLTSLSMFIFGYLELKNRVN